MARVDILLSTYNGGRFLPCQLDSILAQTHRDFRLVVRDDGSSDATVEIVGRYAAADPRITILRGAPSGNIGYRASFLALLAAESDADYFAFCDQDDCWKPEKLALAVGALEKAGGRPALYTSSYDYCDEETRVTGAPAALPPGPPPFRQTLFYNSAFGFTVAINRALREKAIAAAPFCPDVPHDKLCAQLALVFGDYIRDERSTALYRRHSGTVTGSGQSILKKISAWARNDILGGTIAEYRAHARQMSDALGALGRGDCEAARTLRLFGAAPSFARFLRSLLFTHRLRPSLGGELSLRAAFAIGR